MLTRQLSADKYCYSWATKQLVEEGFLTPEKLNNDLYYRYYSNYDDVRENVNKIKTENEKLKLGVTIYENNRQKILENIFSIAKSFPSLTIPRNEFHAMFEKMLKDNGWSDDKTVTSGIWNSFCNFEGGVAPIRKKYFTYKHESGKASEIVFRNIP